MTADALRGDDVPRDEVTPNELPRDEVPREVLATSFDEDVANYDRARPRYPTELFERLERWCGMGAGTRVLEIGPGTGLATLPLLELGAEIVAVEPGHNMVAYLRRRVEGRRCRVIESRFEDASVDGAFDLAVAGTSFHWVEPVAGIEKLARLLPCGAWLALFWNVHAHPGEVDEAWHAALTGVARRFGADQPSDGPIYPFDVDARTADITTGGHFEMVEHEIIGWTHIHDAESMRALFASFSNWSTIAEPDRTTALDEVAALVDERFGGSITRTYSTALYVARRL
jgi:SAM-dependent methyltransferase